MKDTLGGNATVSTQYLSDMSLNFLQKDDCRLLLDLCRPEENGEPRRKAIGQSDLSFPLSKSEDEHEEDRCPGVKRVSILAWLESSNHTWIALHPSRT